MKKDSKQFVRACLVCQKCKDENVKMLGLLQPLAVPDRAWKDSMDFIEGLPKSFGYTVIWVIVDRFSKYAHFIPLAIL